MPKDGVSYTIGNVGENAKVQQGEYLINIELNLQNVEDAKKILEQVKDIGNRQYKGPLLRRLDPIVLINRADYLNKISRFLEQSTASLLYIHGLLGIGKSTLVRGALEFRRSGTPVVWLTCEGLDAVTLLSEINAGLNLNVQTLLANSEVNLSQKLAIILQTITQPSILIFDGFESLLDSEDRYRSKDIENLMKMLINTEHKAKVLITTRRLPHEAYKGITGIEIFRVDGLDKENATNLFKIRAGIPSQEEVIPDEVFARLEGHPKFIELLASSIRELPIKQVISGLLTVTDIGKFLTDELLGIISTEELQILRAASVFRSTFTFDALNASYNDLYNEGLPTEALRLLTRRAVLEINTKPQITYYLHNLLRDAIPRSVKQEAKAHAAAAKWFMQRPFNPLDSGTWDDALYHLRRSLELGKKREYFEQYYSFINEHYDQLRFAGWSYRLNQEGSSLHLFAKKRNLLEHEVIILKNLSTGLTDLHSSDEAESVLEYLINRLANALKHSHLNKEDWLFCKVSLVQATCMWGEILASKDLESASDLADEVELLVKDIEEVLKEDSRFTNIIRGIKLDYTGLRFEIACNRKDVQMMLHWAREDLRLAEKQLQSKPSLNSKDLVSESYAKIGASFRASFNRNRSMKDLVNAITFFRKRLQIKLEIGKILGVAASLYELCLIYASVPEYLPGGIAMLLAAEQIEVETNATISHHFRERIQEQLHQFFADPIKMERGRAILSSISETLVPYYNRALQRYLNH